MSVLQENCCGESRVCGWLVGWEGTTTDTGPIWRTYKTCAVQSECTYIHVYKYMYMYIYMYIYVHTHVHMHVHMHVHVHPMISLHSSHC